MKRTVFLLIAALTATISCTQKPEEKISEIFEYWSKDSTLVATAVKLDNNFNGRYIGSQSNSDVIDYFSLLMSKNLYTEDIYTITADSTESLNLEADITVKGKKASGKTILVSAPVDTWTDSLGVTHDNLDACLAALNVVSSIKKLRIKGSNNIRLLLYQSCNGTLKGLSTSYKEYERKGDEILFQIDLRSEYDESRKFYIGETPSIFNTFKDIVPPFFAPYGEYTFEQIPVVEDCWPVKAPHYRYNVNRNSLASDIAAVTSLITLLD